MERVGLAAGSALAVAPTQLPRPPGWKAGPRLAQEQPSGKPRRQEPWEVAWEAQGSGEEGDNWRGARGPAPSLVVTCSLAGVSRGGRPLPALSPHAVAHAGSLAGPHAPEAAGLSAASRSCPGPRRPGSTAPASRHRALLDLPQGARCARAPALPQTLRARGEREVADSPAQSQVAGPGGPATVPGRRPAPLEGRREGAGTAAATPCSLGAPSWGRPPGACHSPA